MNSDLERSALAAALAGVARGDQQALRTVYDRTSAKLFGVCLSILKNEPEAEDVLQDVYVTVWRRAESFDPAKASPVTWLAAIARNRAIDRLRARKGRPVETDISDMTIADDAPTAEAVLAENEDLRLLEHCLGALEPAHAGAVRQAFFGGLTYEALARRLDMPLGTLKSWMRRSLGKLKACLER